MAPIFSGSLQPKKKSELQDIAVALRISDLGTKEEIVQRISKHLDANQDSLEENPAFSGLFIRRKRSVQSQPIPRYFPFMFHDHRCRSTRFSSRFLPSATGEKPRSLGRISSALDPISESTPTKDLRDVSTFLKHPISPIDTEPINPNHHQVATSPTKSLIERLPNVPVDDVVRRIKHHEFVQSGNDLLISLRLVSLFSEDYALVFSSLITSSSCQTRVIFGLFQCSLNSSPFWRALSLGNIFRYISCSCTSLLLIL